MKSRFLSEFLLRVTFSWSPLPFIATFLFYGALFQFLTELFKVFDFYRRLSPPQKLNMTILKIRRFFISFSDSDQATFYFRRALVSIFLSSLLSHDQDKIKVLSIKNKKHSHLHPHPLKKYTLPTLFTNYSVTVEYI